MGRGKSSKKSSVNVDDGAAVIIGSSNNRRVQPLDALSKLEKHLEDVSQYCNPSNDVKDSLASAMKLLFDSSVALSKAQFGPFTELIVDGFDCETIWEEVQTRNRPLIRFIKKKTTKIIRNVKAKNNIAAATVAHNGSIPKQVIDDDGYAYEEYGEDEVDNDDEADAAGNSDEDEENGQEDDNYANNDDDDEDGDEEEEEEEGVGFGEENEEEDDDEVIDMDSKAPSSKQHFDEDEEVNMEKWLDSMEDMEDKHQRKLERLEKLAGHKGAAEQELSDDEDDEYDLMYVEGALYEDSDNNDDDDDEEDEDGEVTGASRLPKGDQIRFQDFFVPEKKKKISRQKATETNKRGEKRGEKKNSRAMEEDDDDDDDGGFDFGDDANKSDGEDEEEGDFDAEDDYNDDEDASDTEKQDKSQPQAAGLTNFQKRQQKLAQEIAEYEKNLLGPKKWEMRGEAKAANRPEDSLLGIVAQVDRASKPAPVATEELTSSIEDLIIQRIKDEKFDDVVPKERTDDADLSVGNNGSTELSQEKSKLGLGDVYAEDFLKKSTGGHLTAQAAKEDALRFEAKEIFHKVCRLLDGLSHFHYTPRPIISEAKITGSGPEAALPSLALEDILPLTEAGATTSISAPEEVQEKKTGRDAGLVSEAEMSRDDRRRLHRATKAAKRKENKTKEFNEKRTAQQDTAEGYAAERRIEDKKTDEVLRKDRRVIDATGSAGGKGGNKKRKGRGDDDGDDDKPDLTAYTKSAAFFSNLQRVAQDEISGVKSKVSKKKNKTNRGADSNAAAFKL